MVRKWCDAMRRKLYSIKQWILTRNELDKQIFWKSIDHKILKIYNNKIVTYSKIYYDLIWLERNEKLGRFCAQSN